MPFRGKIPTLAKGLFFVQQYRAPITPRESHDNINVLKAVAKSLWDSTMGPIRVLATKSFSLTTPRMQAQKKKKTKKPSA